MASGKSDEVKGRAKEAVGALTGDAKLKQEGRTDQAAGEVKQKAEKLIDKVKEAIAARTDPGLVIIARTNSRRVHDLDEALRRAEAFHRAGADMLFVHTRDAEEMRLAGYVDSIPEIDVCQ